ncbi:hypothetical protein [Duncaniella muris]|jgi:hypothetical protein|uniref:hypothetical protein n=1 Tax=Duncaniella muris TaxID=2094150 RepID=UPI0025A58874|nr:hypothetical protein [Duncaniella muris]
MQTTYFKHSIPAKTVSLAKVVMPSGQCYVVRADQVHPGNFRETATIYNSFQLFYCQMCLCSRVAMPSESWSDFERDAYCCGRSPDPYSVEMKWKQKQAIVREDRIDALCFLRELKKAGGIAQYNHPSQALKMIESRLTLLFGNYLQVKWLLGHFGLM